MTKEDLFTMTITKWGERSQFEMAQEEAIELALACRRFIRQPTEERLHDLAGEIADVEIMIEQLKIMQEKLPSMVKTIKALKLNRLEKRVKNNQYEGE